MTRAAGRARSVPAVVVPALLVLALLLPVLTRGRAVLGFDLTAFIIPQLTQLGRAYERFSIPGWNPLCGLGQPYLADPNVAAFYPPHLLALLVSPVTTLQLLIAGHLVLGYVGAWRLGRARGLSPLASHVVGLAHGLGGVAIGYAGNPPLLFGSALMPWAVLLALPALCRGAPAWRTLLAAAPFALAYLCGSPESCVMPALIALALALGDGVDRPWRSALRLGGVAVVAIALAAVTLVPFVLISRDTNRSGGLAYEAAAVWSLRPLELLGVIVPGRLPVEVLQAGPLARRPWHPVAFEGIVTLALAAAGVAATWRRPATRALAIVLALSVLYALGENGPLYPLLWKLAPPVRLVRYPAKALGLAGLALALLAGVGLDALGGASPATRASAARAGLATGGGAALATAALATWALAHHERALALQSALGLGASLAVVLAARLARDRVRRVLVVTLALELVASAALSLELGPRDIFASSPPRFAKVLQREEAARGQPVRVTPLADVVAGAAMELDGVSPLGQVFAVEREVLVPNAPASWGLRSAYEMSSYLSWRADALRRRARATPGLRLLQLQGVTHVVALTEQLPTPELEPIDVQGAIALARLPGAAPWAAVYPGAYPAANAEAALERVLAPDFAPRRECVVEGAPPSEAPRPGGPRPARPVRIEADRIELEVEPPPGAGSAWLIVREGFASGWTATVDGVAVPVLPADVVFRAVQVPSGRHVVVLRYDVRGRAPAAWTSAAAWLLVAGAALTRWRRG